MLNLYLVLLGGKHAQAHIEVHDIRPVICTDLSHSYGKLKQQWFGLKQGVHIDGWMKIHGVSYQGIDYRVVIQPEPPHQSIQLKLYLINLGAYVPHLFGEIHKYVVVAGHDPMDAKQQGKLFIEQHWEKAHTDAVIDVDDCIELTLFDDYHIHLEQGHYDVNQFKNDYIII